MTERVYKSSPEARARTKKWMQDNPERAKATRAAWYKVNYPKNAARFKAHSKAWAARNPLHNRYSKARVLVGVEPKAMVALHIAQGGRCRMCGEKPKKFLCMDHHHAKKKFRGLICQRCNLGIGYLRDDPGFIRAVAGYVEFDGGYAPGLTAGLCP